MPQGWHKEESAFIYQRDQDDYLGSASEGCSGTLFLFIRTSHFGAEAERSYFFFDLRLKMFLRGSTNELSFSVTPRLFYLEDLSTFQ